MLTGASVGDPPRGAADAGAADGGGAAAAAGGGAAVRAAFAVAAFAAAAGAGAGAAESSAWILGSTAIGEAVGTLGPAGTAIGVVPAPVGVSTRRRNEPSRGGDLRPWYSRLAASSCHSERPSDP